MRFTVFAGAVLLLGASLAAGQERKFTFIDLQPQANQKLKDNLGNEGNNLESLPRDEQVFEGIKFKIGEGLIQLSSTNVQDRPEKVDGIKIGTTFKKLHILHACHYETKADAIVGYYTVNYEDKSQETIPIVYGKDTGDWWYKDDSAVPTRAKVAWKGSNDEAKSNGSKIRLYLTTWKNPEPARKVVSVDFGSTNHTEAAPFCVAISAEE
jgi:hypothetical protein